MLINGKRFCARGNGSAGMTPGIFLFGHFVDDGINNMHPCTPWCRFLCYLGTVYFVNICLGSQPDTILTQHTTNELKWPFLI